MGTRKLINNLSVEELEIACTLKVYTKCPEKWILTDLETGQVYVGNREEKWDKITNEGN